MERVSLSIAGMSCGHCVGAVAGALKALAGVRVENVAVGSATVSYDPGVTTPDEITRAVEDAGYDAHLAGAAR
jgi:copper chaperone